MVAIVCDSETHEIADFECAMKLLEAAEIQESQSFSRLSGVLLKPSSTRLGGECVRIWRNPYAALALTAKEIQEFQEMGVVPEEGQKIA